MNTIKQKTILLVEDEALINISEKQTLKKHGFNVISATSGQKAIEIARTTADIDLILMDINLGNGKMDGAEAAQIILKERDIPILFLSNYIHPEVLQKAEQIASYGYIVKDSGETVLITSINMAFKLCETNQKLKEREKTLQAFFDAVHESMVLIDIDGKVLLSNTIGAQRLGKAVPEIVGTCLYDHFPQDVALHRKKQYDKIIVTGEPVYFQDARAGRFFEQHCYPVFDEEKKVSGVTIFAHEITDRKQAEEELFNEMSNPERSNT